MGMAKPPMRILVISTEEYLTLRLLKCLAPLNAEVYVVGAGSCPTLHASQFCRRYDGFPPPLFAGSPEMLRTEIDHYCRRHEIDVVLPSGMASSFLLSPWKGSCGTACLLPIAPLEMLKVLNNKWFFSRLLQQQALPFPDSRLIERNEDAETLDLKFPVILKPLEMDASRGVIRCDTVAAVASHLKRPGVALPLIAQEYIPGVDVGLGLLACHGTVGAWTIQKQLADGSGIEFIEHEQILEIGRRIMAACEYHGIAHFDLRIDERDGSIKVLECNPRFWASLPFCMLAGVNFADLAIRLALDEPLPKASYQMLGITFPTKILSGALRGEVSCWNIAEPSRKALQFTLSDPLPYVCRGADRVRRTAEAFFLRKPRELLG